jgi:hypothetical protein
MPVIRIPEPVYKRLQAIAIPLEDTPVTVIERLLNDYEMHRECKPTNFSSVGFTALIHADENVIDLGNPSSLDKILDHTKPIRAIVNDKEVPKPNWSKIVDVVHELVVQQGMTIDDLIKLSLSNIVKGEKSDSGFHYLPELDISLQGVSANLAWCNALHLMENSKLPIQVYFEWRDKKAAMHPGKQGKVSWCPE